MGVLPLHTTWRRWPSRRFWQSLTGRLFLCGVVLCGLLFPNLVTANAVSERDVAAAHSAMARGTQAFQQGDFGQAAHHWLVAVRLYEHAGDPAHQTVALMQLAEAYQELGQLHNARQRLLAAQLLARTSALRQHQASIFGSLGNVYIILGQVDRAAQAIQSALDLARDIPDAALVAALLHTQGNLYASQQQYREALQAYDASIKHAEPTTNPAFIMRALTNAASAALQHGQYTTSRTLLDQAQGRVQDVANTHDKAYDLINMGLLYARLSARLPDATEVLMRRAAGALQEAATLARSVGTWRAASYAWGYLGQLYEDEQRHPEALQLTRQAVFAAQQVHAPESLYRWQWQTGRLLYALGDMDAAIAAYRRTVKTLQSIGNEVTRSASKVT